jgi:hypothetical protein
LSRRARLAWIVATGLLGLPSLLALWLLYPRREGLEVPAPLASAPALA